jgi:hypothetical protein
MGPKLWLAPMVLTVVNPAMMKSTWQGSAGRRALVQTSVEPFTVLAGSLRKSVPRHQGPPGLQGISRNISFQAEHADWLQIFTAGLTNLITVIYFG